MSTIIYFERARSDYGHLLVDIAKLAVLAGTNVERQRLPAASENLQMLSEILQVAISKVEFEKAYFAAISDRQSEDLPH